MLELIIGLVLSFSFGVHANEATPDTRRNAARLAHVIWPTAPRAAVRSWADAHAAEETRLLVHQPAARMAELIRAELAARADGVAPNAERLNQTLEILFEVPRQLDGQKRSNPFGEKMKRQLYALSIQMVGAGTAAAGACARLFDHAPVFNAMLYGGLGLTAATVTYVFVNLTFDDVPALPGQTYFATRRALDKGLIKLSRSLAERLRAMPEWDRVFPNVDPQWVAEDLEALLRSVWSPEAVREAAAERFGQAG